MAMLWCKMPPSFSNQTMSLVIFPALSSLLAFSSGSISEAGFQIKHVADEVACLQGDMGICGQVDFVQQSR